MSLFRRTEDPAAEQHRTQRQRVAAEFERRRQADEEQAARVAAANRRPTAEEQEHDAKAAILARQQQRQQRDAQISPYKALRSQISNVAAQAASDRDRALELLDLEGAIAAQQRATACSALLAPLESAVCRRFSVGSF